MAEDVLDVNVRVGPGPACDGPEYNKKNQVKYTNAYKFIHGMRITKTSFNWGRSDIYRFFRP